MACNETGEVVKGRLSATSEEAATELLGYAGYQAISLKSLAQFSALNKLLRRLFRIKPAEIILFNRQLALLLESGLNITTSLELLQGHTSSRILTRVLGEVISDVRSGNQLSVALAKHPEIFSPIHCRSLSVGEQTGDLETILRQIADYIEKEVMAAKDIKNALMYPVIASVVAIAVIGLMVTFVLPAFSNLYTSLGADLPLLTKIVMDAAVMLQSYGIYLLLAIFVAAGLTLTYTKTPDGKYKVDKLALGLPLVGRINHLNELARCCRSLSLLFQAGLPLTEIMPLVIQGSGNRVMARALADVQQGMLKGEGLSQPMAKSEYFPPMMVQMVKVGEETGRLDVTLSAVAQSYDSEATDRTQSLIGFIQPAMTLMIAGVIGLIALSLVSAMYSIYGQVL